MRIFFKCPFHIADLVKIKMLTLYAHDSFCMSNIAASFILLYVPMILNNVIQPKNIQSWKTVIFPFIWFGKIYSVIRGQTINTQMV